MVETSDLEPRRSRWQALAGALVILLALAAVASLAAYRYLSTRPQRAQGSVVGSVQVAPGFSLRCTLPVTAYGRTVAMISFPDGLVTVDRSAAATSQGKGIYSYDAALRKWLPVQHQWVSPDGRSYAFATMTTGLPGQPPTADVRVRDAAGGQERTVWKGEGNAGVLGWSASTVYFTVQGLGGPTPAATPEIWAVDASGANLHRVGPNPPPPPPAPGQPFYSFGGGFVGGGAIWSLTASKPPTAKPAQPGAAAPFAGPDTVTRMDLRTGSVATWYTAPSGHVVSVVGVDADGHPILTQTEPVSFSGPPPAGFTPPAPTYLVLTARGEATPLEVTGSPLYLSSVAADSHGTWFSAPGQLWLESGGRLAKVADVPEKLFPAPTPPPGVVAPGGGTEAKPGIAVRAPSGPFLQIAGACT